MTELTFERITEIPDGLTLPNAIPNGSELFGLVHDGCTDKEWDPDAYPAENEVRNYLKNNGYELHIRRLRQKENNAGSCLIAIFRNKVRETVTAET